MLSFFFIPLFVRSTNAHPYYPQCRRRATSAVLRSPSRRISSSTRAWPTYIHTSSFGNPIRHHLYICHKHRASYLPFCLALASASSISAFGFFRHKRSRTDIDLDVDSFHPLTTTLRFLHLVRIHTTASHRSAICLFSFHVHNIIGGHQCT